MAYLSQDIAPEFIDFREKAESFGFSKEEALNMWTTCFAAQDEDQWEEGLLEWRKSMDRLRANVMHK